MKASANTQCYSSYAITLLQFWNENFMGADLVEPNIFLLVALLKLLSILRVFLNLALPLNEIVFNGKAEKQIESRNASEHCDNIVLSDKARNLYRKNAEDALGHAIGINSLELNANTNMRSNFFSFDVCVCTGSI